MRHTTSFTVKITAAYSDRPGTSADDPTYLTQQIFLERIPTNLGPIELTWVEIVGGLVDRDGVPA